MIQEEIQRAKKSGEATDSESFGTPVAHVKHPCNVISPDDRKLQELERENMDLKIANRSEDYQIGELNKERTTFFDQRLIANRTLGQLETKLHQLDEPKCE